MQKTEAATANRPAISEFCADGSERTTWINDAGHAIVFRFALSP